MLRRPGGNPTTRHSMPAKSALAPSGLARLQSVTASTWKLPYRSKKARPAAAYSPSAPGAPPGPATAGPANEPVRHYTNFTVYRTRSAMSVKVVPPVWHVGPRGREMSLERQGAVLLELANATAGGGVAQGGGAVSRTFDWGSKLSFELYTDDLGVLLAGIAQGAVTINRGVVNPEEEDPGYEPGYVARLQEQQQYPTAPKKLNVTVAPDGSNYFFTVTSGPYSIQAAMSKGEFVVFKSVVQFAAPRLLGFDKVRSRQ